jgi:Na+-driven multidrug efflux pump
VHGGRRRRLFPFTALDREILCNALACAGASMSDPLMSLVDSYYAGKLGTTSLAALGSNGALFSVLYFLCFTALAVLCTQVRRG